MKKFLVLFLGLCLGLGIQIPDAVAQYSINAGDHNIEFSGVLYGFYNYRFDRGSQFNSFTSSPPQPGADYNNNRFDMRSIVTTIEGRYRNDIEWQFQYNFSKTVANDPENPALMDAYVTYKAFKPFNIKVGYQKLPFSRSSLVSFQQMPFMQRAEFARGEVFSRRDIGVTLSQNYWNQRINVYAGAYTGQGEASILGVNDMNGKLEYIGRIDVSYPQRMRYREIDANHSSTPVVQLGVNARYKRRDNPGIDTVNRYGMKNIQGTKRVLGGDLTVFYKGFSLLAEAQYIRIYPGSSVLEASIPQLYRPYTSYYNAAGMMWQLNYHSKPLKSVFSVRYDRFMANDLAADRAPTDFYALPSGLDFTRNIANNATQENLSFAYVYMLSGWNNCFRLDYRMRLRKDLDNYRNAADQLRIGFQFAM